MEIVKLEACLKDYLWGGRKLVDLYNKVSDLEKVAESWEMSNHRDGCSTIISDNYKGMLFSDYLNEKGKEAWGTKCESNNDFPIMIKFIDAKQALSIQVHPDDDYARIHENDSGKNEFWYVLEAEEDAFLYCGVNKTLTKEEYKASILDGTVCEHLNKVKVKKGDCFYIETGTIHAIGAGIVIAEIQQCSNATYRVFDFNRLGVDGNPRELHIDKAVDVSCLQVKEKMLSHDTQMTSNDNFTKQVLTENKYFICERYEIVDCVELDITEESFQSILVVDGQGTINIDHQEIDIKKGESYFLPAQIGKYVIKGNTTIILTKAG